MAHDKHKPLMRSLGEFFGHIVRGIRADPTAPAREQDPTPRRTIVRQEVRQEDRGNMILRRTTIEEVEIRPPAETEVEAEAETETDAERADAS